MTLTDEDRAAIAKLIEEYAPTENGLRTATTLAWHRALAAGMERAARICDKRKLGKTPEDIEAGECARAIRFAAAIRAAAKDQP